MRQTFLSRSVVITVLFLIVTSTCRANWICCEGDEWLRWDAQTRSVYVRAYTWGYSEGYTSGCHNGLVASKPEMNGSYTMEASKRCSESASVTSRDSSHFADRITEFYQKYPQQRFLRISDILLGLYAGKTLEEIHNSFPKK
jgi:hypothetical protein